LEFVTMTNENADRIILQFVSDTITGPIHPPLSIDIVQAVACLAERVEGTAIATGGTK
jgi:hypothetical protein